MIGSRLTIATRFEHAAKWTALPLGWFCWAGRLARSPRPRRHLAAALCALLLAAAGLLALVQYALAVESRYVHAVAPLLFVQKFNGSALQRLALRQPDLLLVYGASEIANPDVFNARNLFASYPTGFTIFPIAHSGESNLITVQDIAALGSDLRGRKVVISFTPADFMTAEAGRAEIAGNFSSLHANEFVFSPDLSYELKRDAARRMLEYPGTLEADPLLQFGLTQLASGTLAGRLLYLAVVPLGRLHLAILEMQDHWQTLLFLLSHPHIQPETSRVPTPVRWDDLLSRAREAPPPPSLDHASDLRNMLGRRYYQAHRTFLMLGQHHPGSADGPFLGRLNTSREWGDFELVLRELRELGAQPLVVSEPFNGPLYERLGVSAGARAVYYRRLEALGQQYGVAVVDFADHDQDPAFAMDRVSHPAPEGWIYLDEAFDAFYHGTLR